MSHTSYYIQLSSLPFEVNWCPINYEELILQYSYYWKLEVVRYSQAVTYKWYYTWLLQRDDTWFLQHSPFWIDRLLKNSVRFMIHRDDTWLLWAVGQLKICSSVADGKGIGLLVHNFIDDHHNAHNAKLVMSKMHLCCY